MKGKFTDLLNRYLLIVLAFLPAVLLSRLVEFLSLSYTHTVPGNTWILELYGYVIDNLGYFSFSILLFIPFLLLFLLNRKTAVTVILILYILYTVIALSLSEYFTVTLLPLDQVIFFYTPRELLRIAISSTQFNFTGLVVFLLVVLTPLVVYFFIRKVRLKTASLVIFPLILLASPAILVRITPRQADFKNDFDYFAASGKVEYLVRKVISFKTAKVDYQKNDESFPATVKRYHYRNREFSYTDPQYPLLRADVTPDVLGEYFTFSREKPNLVFIIVESLSSSFCGDHPYYGSFMPFLDSLIGQGLYWENFLATSERTFNVLPAVFGSLPFSGEVFRQPYPPLHFSMIRYLREAGYYTCFFYGGDPVLGGYRNFLENERTDFILDYFGKGYNDPFVQRKLFKWGYFDSDLFRRSAEVLDSIDRSPRMEMYLTLSMHAPFTTPDPRRFRQMFDRHMEKMNLSRGTKRMVLLDRDVFTTILYTDDALRSFFNYYRKRADFSNTIFIITGDHAMAEIHYTYLNVLEKYHVPFIIYSPMLKKPHRFQSVSSHLDITPSVLAMLKKQGFITTRPVCHWLGRGIDVSGPFRNHHTVAFINNNREQAEYIHGEYFLTYDRLYRLLPGFKLYPDRNVIRKEKINGELEDYLSIAADVARRKTMVPDELFISGSYTGMPYLSAKPEAIDKTVTSEKYISLVRGHKISDDFQFFSIDLSLILENSDRDSLKIPRVVFQVQDDRYQNCAWFQFTLKTAARTGEIKRMVLKKYIDVSTVKDIRSKILKIYLYNINQEELYLISMRLDLKGYKPVN